MVQRSLFPLPVNYRLPQRISFRMLIASVVFGQNSLGCRGNGICRVDMVTSKSKAFKAVDPTRLGEMCTRTSVEISRNEAKTMRFTFQEALIDPLTMAKYFEEPFFEVKEQFEIPDRIVDELGLEKKWVAIGFYYIERINNALIIDF